MVTTDGFAKILDFGLGKLTAPFDDDQSQLETIEVAAARTTPGTILGTVHYMSPEQAAGRHIDFRSDQFAFGLVLYEMVTGRVAFARPTAVQTMSAIIAEEPQRVADLNPHVPERLQEIIRRCLAKAPAERYASTLDLARDVRLVARHESHISVVQPTSRRASWSQRKRTALAAALAAAAVAVAALVIAPSLPQALGRWARGPAEEPIPARKNVAVLPFRVAGGLSQASADGLSAMLSAMLAKLTTAPALQIAPANQVRASQLDDATEARSDSGATLVLSGTLEQVGDVISVTSEIVDTSTSRQLRVRTATAPAADFFALQDRLLETALEMLDVTVTASDRLALVPRDTRIGGANVLHIQGRGYLQVPTRSRRTLSARSRRSRRR